MVATHLSPYKKGSLWYVQFTDENGQRKQTSARERQKRWSQAVVTPAPRQIELHAHTPYSTRT